MLSEMSLLLCHIRLLLKDRDRTECGHVILKGVVVCRKYYKCRNQKIIMLIEINKMNELTTGLLLDAEEKNNNKCDRSSS